MTERIKVYIDTNLIIHGKDYRECLRLKELCNEGKILIYISPEVHTEQQKKSLDHRFGDLRDKERQYGFTYDSFSSTELMRELVKQKQLKDMEESEWSFWEGCKFDMAFSTFGGLCIMCMASLPSDILIKHDTKREFAKLNDLIKKYGLEKEDAIHLMHAQSSGMDCLSTKDKKFIKKAKNVPWLKVEVIEPTELLNKIDCNVDVAGSR